MKQSLLILLAFILLIAAGCGGGTAGSQTDQAANANSQRPADGYYKGDGTVTKINNELGSVEIDHGEIAGLMPPMKMEFSVTDKAMLEGLSVGETVTFMIEYRQGAEKIASIEKSK